MPDDSIGVSLSENSKSRPLEFEKAEDFIRVYANHAVVLTTPYDFQIVFGEILEATESRMRVMNHAHITMTAEHAWQLYGVLGKKLAAFQEAIRRSEDVSAGAAPEALP